MDFVCFFDTGSERQDNCFFPFPRTPTCGATCNGGPILNSTLSENERIQLAQLVMDIFEDWQLSSEQQLELLGLPSGTKPRELTRFRHGSPFPPVDSVLERAKHILGIQHSLHVVFPRNHNMPNFWLRNRNRQLKDRPLAIMLGEGLSGMNRVWRSLDCTLNWE